MFKAKLTLDIFHCSLTSDSKCDCFYYKPFPTALRNKKLKKNMNTTDSTNFIQEDIHEEL